MTTRDLEKFAYPCNEKTENLKTSVLDNSF